MLKQVQHDEKMGWIPTPSPEEEGECFARQATAA